jgi:hypothetical protein
LDARTPAAALPRDRTGDVFDVRGVSMRYSGADGGVLALKDINFAVADGEFMAIVGPSGCGKTTLLKIHAGLLGGGRGQGDFEGHADRQAAARHRRRVPKPGVALRDLPNTDVSKFPSSGMYALEENISNKRAQLVALGGAFAMGQIFAMANPEAAVHILWEIFPQTKPTGIDEVTALANEVKLLNARAQSWSLDADRAGVKRWGESVGANYQAYCDWLLQQNVIKQKLAAQEAFTNELIDDINKFDATEVTAMARAYKGK